MGQKFFDIGIVQGVRGKRNVSQTKEYFVNEFIIDTGDSNNPNPVKFQATGKYADLPNENMVGSLVLVEFYINGFKTEKGTFNNLSVVGLYMKGRPKQSQDNNSSPSYDDDVIF